MKILKILEKNKLFWYLLGCYVLFFLLRLPSLIEPNWYGDEGIYQVIGKALNNNRVLYTQIFDNKPPLLYITYALFNGEQFPVRIFSLISGLISVIAFFYLSTLTFKNLKSSIISTSIFLFLFATPIMEGNIANAENFMLLPIISAGILIYSYSQNTKYSPRDEAGKILNTKYSTLITSGFLLGLAFLFKIVAVFDFAAFFIFMLITNFPDRFHLSLSRMKSLYSSTLAPQIPLVIGFLLPLIFTGLYFISQNAFSEFAKATFSSNVGYVGYGNKFIIPQGFLLLKLFLISTYVIFVFLKRKNLTTPLIFILTWFAFSLFNTFFSGRPYMHYTLVMLPAFCLLIGLLFEKNKLKTQSIIFIILILSIAVLNKTFKFNLPRTIRYYDNSISFISGKKDVESYQNFFDRKTPRDYQIASYLKSHTTQSDNVFIWGDSAQIYALSDKLPPGRYTVAYHITQYKNALSETESAVKNANPKYIIILNGSRSFPFSIPNYNSKIVFNESVIYERSL